jgi:choline kinase
VKAVILNAGQGRRMLPLTATKPKCLLPVGGRSMADWQIETLANCGVREVTVVVGFGAEKVRAALHDWTRPAVEIETVFNSFFDVADNLVSCWVAREAMDDDFVLLNGDTLFKSHVLARLLASPPAPVTVAISHKSTYDADDMKVECRGRQLLAIGKDLPLERTTGESIGMLLFRGDGPRLFRAGLEAAVRETTSRRKYYLSVVGELAARGHVQTTAVDRLSWTEIDFPRDLEIARALVETWGRGTVRPPHREATLPLHT